jgi:hypothetical protein
MIHDLRAESELKVRRGYAEAGLCRGDCAILVPRVSARFLPVKEVLLPLGHVQLGLPGARPALTRSNSVDPAFFSCVHFLTSLFFHIFRSQLSVYMNDFRTVTVPSDP